MKNIWNHLDSPTFHYTGCLTGILIMVYIIPIEIGSMIPYKPWTTRVRFFIAQLVHDFLISGFRWSWRQAPHVGISHTSWLHCDSLKRQELQNRKKHVCYVFWFPSRFIFDQIKWIYIYVYIYIYKYIFKQFQTNIQTKCWERICFPLLKDIWYISFFLC